MSRNTLGHAHAIFYSEMHKDGLVWLLTVGATFMASALTIGGRYWAP